MTRCVKLWSWLVMVVLLAALPVPQEALAVMVGSRVGTTVVTTGADDHDDATNTSIGKGSNAGFDGMYATAVGYDANATSTNSTAIGANAFAWVLGTAVGASSSASRWSTALGQNATASAINSVALGYDSVADEEDTVSVGTSTSQRRITNVATAVDGTDAVNLDQVESLIVTGGEQWLNSTETGSASVAGSNATAIGSGSFATADGSVALGQGSIADEENTLSVGSDGNERRITNVADGVNDSDAVNMSQLNTVQNQVSGNAAAIATNSSAITAIEAQSAVLSSSESDSASSSGSNSLAIGSGASAHDYDTAIGANATVTADSSTAVGSNTLITSEQAVAVGADATVSSEATGGVAIGQNAVVEQGASNAVALGQDSVADEANTVSVGSSDNQRRVTNVADGENDGDAVNVSQLNTVKSDVSSNSVAIAENTEAITSNSTAIESEAETRAAADEVQQADIASNRTAIEDNSSAITEVGQTLNDTREAVVHLDRRVDQLENEMDEVAALASAFSALVPNARSASNTQLSLGLGNYGNANAVALGVFHYVNDNVLVNVGASTAFDNRKTAARAGITIGF